MIEQIDRKAKTHKLHFDSLSELAQYLETAPRTWSSTSSADPKASAASWDLGAGYLGARDMARYGWNDGAQRAQEALKQLVLMSAAPENKNDFYGHLPHVARYCAGAPDSMIRKARSGFGGGRTLTLVVPCNAVSNVKAECMANWGVGIAQYINQLETDGLRVEIIGAMYSKMFSRWELSQTWTIKRAEQPLDLAVLAFSVGHPAMFRRLGFAMYERSAAPTDSGYGRSEPITLDQVISPPSGAIILNGMTNANSLASTPEVALKNIGKQIEAALEQVP